MSCRPAVKRETMADTRKRREDGPFSRPGLLVEALQEVAPPRYFMLEYYGPDGEIVEAWEGHPIGQDHAGVEAVIITGTDSAEPRTDWRERGVVPPRGLHRSHWRP